VQGETSTNKDFFVGGKAISSSKGTNRASTALASSASGAALAFADDLRDALAAMRKGNDYNWLLASYAEDGASVVLVAQGTGSADELATHLKDDQIMVGIVKQIEMVEISTTTKFARISFLGPNVPIMRKARSSTHKNDLEKFFQPYHTELNITQPSECTASLVADKIGAGSGTRVNVKEGVKGSAMLIAGKTVQHQSSAGHSQQQAKGTATQSVDLTYDQALTDALKDLRSDSTPSNWVIGTYHGEKGDNIVLSGSGDGGLEQFMSNLDHTLIQYGLIRQTEQFDKSTTVKFVHVVMIGPKAPLMLRARMSTHKGSTDAFFSPYHTDLRISDASEISQEIITARIGAASGTADHVRASSTST